MANPFSHTCRSLEVDTSRYAWVAWTLASVFLCSWLAWFLLVKVTVVEVSQSARLEVERTAHPIAVSVNGQIISTSLKLGKEVEKGQVLVELDAKNERLHLEEEQARLTAIPPQIEAIKRQIAEKKQAAKRNEVISSSAVKEARWRYKKATLAAQFAEENYQRIKQIGSSGSISQIEILRAHTESEKSKSAAAAISSDIVRLKAVADQNNHSNSATLEALHGKLAELQGQIEISTAVIARLQQNMEKYRIRTPVSGKVGSVEPLDVGSFVNAGAIVGNIIPSGNLKVIAEFPPARVLGRVREGQIAHMRLDGFPWAQYGSISLKVDRIASEIRDGRIRVEFFPDSQDHDMLLLQHGLPGMIEITIEETTPATIALRAAGQMLTKPVQLNTHQIASISQ